MDKHIYDNSYMPIMPIEPIKFYKCLSDETRLNCVLLIQQEQELCVCELTEALQVSQPKISRHLAQLRECGLLKDRRNGQWVFYQINPALPKWAIDIIASTLDNNMSLIKPLIGRLVCMGDRPERKAMCC